MFLARLVTELLPQEPEPQGLLALMLYAEARRCARRNPEGEYVPLAEQEPSLWDEAMINEADLAKAPGSLARLTAPAKPQTALR
jgi:RNA polymerase sigma-70 factor (ECF subfamily)